MLIIELITKIYIKCKNVKINCKYLQVKGNNFYIKYNSKNNTCLQRDMTVNDNMEPSLYIYNIFMHTKSKYIQQKNKSKIYNSYMYKTFYFILFLMMNNHLIFKLNHH